MNIRVGSNEVLPVDSTILISRAELSNSILSNEWLMDESYLLNIRIRYNFDNSKDWLLSFVISIVEMKLFQSRVDIRGFRWILQF